MQINIFHITDLHLNNRSAEGEKLRIGFYKDFIMQLAQKIKAEVGSVDLLMCSGDVINKGNVGNFDWADEVFAYLCGQLGVSRDNSFFTIGNHDIVRNGNNGETGDFLEFASRNCHRKPLFKDQLYSIYQLEDLDLFVICFNSVVNLNGTINEVPGSGFVLPNKLSSSEIDDFFSKFETYIPMGKRVIFQSHFPPNASQRILAMQEESQWADKHIWKSGQLIYLRLEKWRQNVNTVWLCGDGHQPDFWSLDDYFHFFMTGMIGGDYTNPIYKLKAYNKFNEVKVITLQEDTPLPYIRTFIYKPTGHDFHPQLGEWEVNQSRPRIAQKILGEQTDSGAAASIIQSGSDVDEKTKLISVSVQTEIIETIKENRLYKFDRFATTETESSLGWVKIFELFEKGELLCRCIDKSIVWLQGINDIDIDPSNTVLIGVDYGGAVIASQVSVRLGVRSFCLSARKAAKDIHTHENINFVCNKIRRCGCLKNVIIFTDVVSTGNTILTVKREIEKVLPGPTKAKFYAVSIISDKLHIKNDKVESFAAIGTFCSDLRIPIISNALLPDEDILPPRYDIR